MPNYYLLLLAFGANSHPHILFPANTLQLLNVALDSRNHSETFLTILDTPTHGETAMEATLKITSDDLDEKKLQDLTRDLTNTLNRETVLTATLPEEAGEEGAKGDPITLGTILLAAIKSGAVVALFEVLKAYFERKPSLAIEIERGDGQKIKIGAEQLDEEQIGKTIELANDFLGA